MVNTVLLAAEATPTDAATMPIVKHDKAVNMTPIFLYIPILYIVIVQPAFADVDLNHVGPYCLTRGRLGLRAFGRAHDHEENSRASS
jgi:hypothetical protein